MKNKILILSTILLLSGCVTTKSSNHFKSTKIQEINNYLLNQVKQNQSNKIKNVSQ